MLIFILIHAKLEIYSYRPLYNPHTSPDDVKVTLRDTFTNMV